MARKPLVRPGDVFTIPVDAESCGFGHALLVNTQGYKLYIAVHRTLHRTDALPDLSFIVSDDVALIGDTMDALLFHKRWRVIGNVPVNTAQYPWPSFVVRLGGRDVLEAFDGTTIRAAFDDDLTRFNNRFGHQRRRQNLPMGDSGRRARVAIEAPIGTQKFFVSATI